MQKIFFILTLLSTLLFSNELKFVDYDDAIEMAEKNNKIIMVMLSREGCPACEYMKEVVFKDKNVLKRLNSDFIAVYVDIHQDFMPEGLTFVGTPTFHFLDKNEKKLDRLDGGKNSKVFLEKLNAVKANH